MNTAIIVLSVIVGALVATVVIGLWITPKDSGMA